MLLELDRELRTSTNVSFLYDPETTPRAFALKAVRSALSITKPYFVNHPLYAGEWGPDYGIVACYCPVSLAGGVYSLVRLNLKQLVALSNGTLEDVLDHLIPFAAEIMMEITNSEAGFLVEEVKWFDNSVFVKEGLVRRERFTSYAAFYGLAEAVNSLMAEKGRPEARYGHDEEANEMARLILERLAEELARIPACYCESSAGRVRFHSQAGIASDKGVTPGHRICSGDEPGLYNHLRAELPAHHLCAGGCTSILEFDQTAEGNPEAILDIIRGAFKNGARMLSIGSAHSEFVRVTGYLVRRADLEGAKAEKALLYDSAHWASETFDNRPHDLHRRVCQV
jgi:YjjI family glycine radical enzyme